MTSAHSPLASGDHLTRAEFETRAAALPDHVKVELLDGEVYLSTSTKADHGDAHALMTCWLGHYSYATPRTKVSCRTTLRLDEISQPQPDVVLRIVPEAGGHSSVDDEGYLRGPAELVAEIATSESAIDFHRKKEIYLRNGVLEYVILALHEARLSWFAYEGGLYLPLPPDPAGVIRSRVFPGLWLDARAASQGDGATVLHVLHRGLAAQTHASFVRGLRAATRRR